MDVNKVIIVFLDGVGLGDHDPAINPLVNHPTPFLRELFDGKPIIRATNGYSNKRATLMGLDATLGVPGLPQSGTGHTAILTGQNAPAFLGEHQGPYPNGELKSLLAEHNIFRRLLDRGQPAAFANAYPDRFLDRLGRGKGRLTGNTRAAQLAGLKLRGHVELKAERAVSAFLTNKYWREWGYDVPLISAAEAGKNLARLSDDHALTYFEFWFTDATGHRRDMDQAGELLLVLDDFLRGIAAQMNTEKTLLLVISDHGNFEDFSTKQHTFNPALALAHGAEHHRLAELTSLTDIAPFVVEMLASTTDGCPQVTNDE